MPASHTRLLLPDIQAYNGSPLDIKRILDELRGTPFDNSTWPSLIISTAHSKLLISRSHERGLFLSAALASAAVAEQAVKSRQTHIGYLEALLSAELEEREKNTVERRIREASLPKTKTLD